MIFELLPLNSYFFFLGLFQIFKERIYHSFGGRLSELQLNATENQIEKTSSMVRKYTESLISNIEKRFSDSLEILKAFHSLQKSIDRCVLFTKDIECV
jgi:hypothetical protein